MPGIGYVEPNKVASMVNVVKCTDRLDMMIAVDWDVKQQF